jgi:hypothetical protein
MLLERICHARGIVNQRSGARGLFAVIPSEARRQCSTRRPTIRRHARNDNP